MCNFMGFFYVLLSKLFGSKSTNNEKEKNSFENQVLALHNEYRREHGSPPLVLNKELSKHAQKWAEELARKDSMAYSNNEKYGESVYCGWSKDPTTKVSAKDCVEKWYSEINEYCFGTEPGELKCGHFTQLIWKETKELGVGSSKSKSGKLYVVANYSPPGNYSGQFAKNVPPPGANQFKPNQTFAPPKSDPVAPTLPKAKLNEGVVGDIAKQLKSSSYKGSDFDQEVLSAHNEYRKKHGVGPLFLNKEISKYAEDWAKTLSDKGKMEHREDNVYGENIFAAQSSDPNFKLAGKVVVEKWYSEIKDYTFGKEPKDLSTGHFTQVVWEDTQEVGVGSARSKDGRIYVVCNYNPPGNIIGSFGRKVHPPLSKQELQPRTKTASVDGA